MPETACLHIQARDTDPILLSTSRVSRSGSAWASYCEVCLAEPDLAEEECRLRAGGNVAPGPDASPRSVWLDGRSGPDPALCRSASPSAWASTG